MDDVLIIGDGPTGLSAALLLAKNGMGVRVLGEGESGTRKALIRNDLGIEEIDGPAFLETARRQVEAFGARVERREVADVEREPEAFRVETSDGASLRGRYLVLATGWNRGLAEELGLETNGEGVRIDIHGRTSVDRAYAGGSLARGMKSQVATSVGDGAAIAVDILSREKGKPFHDWDVVKPSASSARPTPLRE